jgi:hypothetical protein
MTRTLGMNVRGLLNPNVTGAVIDGPAVRPLNVYAVKEVNGTVRIRV